MKHALLVVTMVVASAAAVAQQPAQASHPRGVPYRISSTEAVSLPAAEKPAEQSQGVVFQRLFTPELASTQFHYFPRGTVSNDAFVYDARTKSLNIARNRALFTSNRISGVEIGVVRSVDNGSTWSFDVIQSSTDIFFGMPVLGLVNPNEVTNPSQLPVSIYGIRYPFPDLAFGGTSLWSRAESGSYEVALNDQAVPAPGFSMLLGDLYADKTGAGISVAGELNAADGVERPWYGMFTFNLIDEDFAAPPKGPDAWGVSAWRPTGTPGTSFGAPMGLDGDEDGNMYAAFNNFVAGSEVRSVQVAKSTDQGKTWSSFNAMPENLFDQFAQANGGDVAFQPGLTPYAGGDFIALGTDEYAMYFRLATGIRSTSNPEQIERILTFHIAEALYRNGIWTLSPVAELSVLEWQMAELLDTVSQNIGAPAVKMENNGRGHEIQVARTEDNSHLVVKWVDVDTNKVNTFSTPVRTFTGNQVSDYIEGDPLTQMWDTEMYVVTRPVGSTSWSSVKNVTEDADMAYRTYMPKVVPSINNIPFLRMLGLGSGSISSQLPKSLAQVLWNTGIGVDFASSSVVSVEEERNYTFRIGTIAPNPASGTSSVAFTLDQPASVSVELYNVMGGKLRTTETRNLDQGMHAETFDVSDLAPGTYNAAIVVNGVRIMKPFVVVR